MDPVLKTPPSFSEQERQALLTPPPPEKLAPAASKGEEWAKNDGVELLAAEHVEQSPSADPQAAEAELRKLAATLDPNIYVIKPDGLPALNKDGSPKKRTGPLPKKLQEQTANAAAQFEGLGMVAAETVFSLCCGLLGDEWQPADEERTAHYHAWGVYLKAKGITDLPPGIVLAGVMVSYVRPRITQPKTSGRIAGALQWVKGKFRRQ